MKTQRKMKTAWLVTWEWSGDHAKRKHKVAAILNSRCSPAGVKELVEFMYLTECYSLSEKMAFAQHRRDNPYPAEFGAIDGVGLGDEILCGHNPYLYARRVDDLTIERTADGEEMPTWKERPKPDVSRMRRARGTTSGV